MFTTSLHLLLNTEALESSRLSTAQCHQPDYRRGHSLSATVLGYTTIFIIGYEPRVCEWGPAATARLLLSPSAVEGTPVLQDLQLLDPSGFGYFWILQDLDIFGNFSAGS